MSEGEPPTGAPAPPDGPGPRPPVGLGRSSAGTPTVRLETAWATSTAPLLPTPSPTPLPRTAPRPAAAPPVVPSPPRSRLPTLVTLAVVLVVGGGVLVGTALAHEADTQLVAAPLPVRSASPGSPGSSVPTPGAAGTRTSVAGTADQIDFSTRRGAGRLRLLAHGWDRPSSATTAPRLRIRLELLCTDGSLDYAPEYFSLFDAAGRLVEPAPVGGGADPLPFGRLGPGERVRGSLAFDVPHGEVTLVLGDDVSAVTALRVPG